MLRVLIFIYEGQYPESSILVDEEETEFQKWIRYSQFNEVEDSQENRAKELHIQMFAAGEKYDLEALQLYARRRFIPLFLSEEQESDQNSIISIFDIKGQHDETVLANIVEFSLLIFETTHESNHGLRDIALLAIKFAISHNGLRNVQLAEMVSGNKDISDMIALSHIKCDMWWCTSCVQAVQYLAKPCQQCYGWDCLKGCTSNWDEICPRCFQALTRDSKLDNLNGEEDSD